MNVILYSTGCPKCAVLTKKLNSKNVEYSVVTSVDEMLKLGIKQAPMLGVDENLMDFKAANEWINKQ